jgi:hypothetical protein
VRVARTGIAIERVDFGAAVIMLGTMTALPLGEGGDDLSRAFRVSCSEG